MNKKHLAELLKYASPYSILVVTYYDKIMELNCPFRVMVRYNIGVLQKGSNQKVVMVKLSTNLKTVFIIDGNAYYYHHFDIIID